MRVESSEGEVAGRGVTLLHRTVRPAERAWARLGVIHGYGDHSGRFLGFMEWMAARGVECHAIDLRGQGRSSGRRGFVSRWEEYLDDIEVLQAQCRGESELPLFMLGHSHGALVLAAAVLHGRVEASGCILTAPYIHRRLAVPWHKVFLAKVANPVLPWFQVPSELKNEWMSADVEAVAESRADPLLVRTATPRWFLESTRVQQEVLRRAAEFRLPLLMLIGDADPIADPETARRFAEAVGSADKSFHLLPGFLHEILREKERESVFSTVLSWMEERAN